MYCAQFGELHSLMDGEPTAARAELERHAASCAACRHELSMFKQTARLVSGLAQLAPPANLRARVARQTGHAGQWARAEQAGGLLRRMAEVEPPASIRQRVRHEAARRARPVYARPAFRGLVATAAVGAVASALMVALHVPSPVQPVTPRVQQMAMPSAPAPSPAIGEQAAGAAAPAAAPASPAMAQMPSPVAAARTAARSMVAAIGSRVTRSSRAPVSSGRVLVARRVGGAAAPTAYFEAAHPRDAASRPPIATPAASAEVALAQPAIEAEPAVLAEPPAGTSSDAMQAGMVSMKEPPLWEVRRALREQSASAAPTLRPKRERDKFSRVKASAWAF